MFMKKQLGSEKSEKPETLTAENHPHPPKLAPTQMRKVPIAENAKKRKKPLKSSPPTKKTKTTALPLGSDKPLLVSGLESTRGN